MTKAALVVAVDAYPPPAVKLKAPVREGKRWKQLLSREYGFGDDVVTLFDKQATRKAVLDALRDLLRKGKPGDDLLFFFGGHGAKTRGWTSDTEPSAQVTHALIVYPGSAEQKAGFHHASITPGDFVRILEEEIKPPPEVRITVVLDTCFGALFGGGPHPAILNTATIESPTSMIDPIALFIPNADPVLTIADYRNVVTFADVPGLLTRNVAKPIFLAAAEADQLASEVGDADDRRLLFSWQAIHRLGRAYDQKKEITNEQLIDRINPLSETQDADIVGNPDLEEVPFTGGFGIAHNLQLSQIADSRTIAVRVLGLASLIALEGNPFRDRIVLPFDNFATTEPMKHRGFIEVADHLLVSPTIGRPPTREYELKGVKYSRWELTAHRVRFGNAIDNGRPVQRTQAFDDDVPSLPVVTPELQGKQPRPACFRDFPQPSLFSGFIDLLSGYITTGHMETNRVLYRGETSQIITRPPRTTPIDVVLTITLDKDYVEILISDEAGERTVIFVRGGSEIRAGNAREADITGNGSGESPREHFGVYYNLTEEHLFDRGLPEIVLLPVNACTVTTWP